MNIPAIHILLMPSVLIRIFMIWIGKLLIISVQRETTHEDSEDAKFFPNLSHVFAGIPLDSVQVYSTCADLNIKQSLEDLIKVQVEMSLFILFFAFPWGKLFLTKYCNSNIKETNTL